jgi:hypothetical protein
MLMQKRFAKMQCRQGLDNVTAHSESGKKLLRSGQMSFFCSLELWKQHEMIFMCLHCFLGARLYDVVCDVCVLPWTSWTGVAKMWNHDKGSGGHSEHSCFSSLRHHDSACS